MFNKQTCCIICTLIAIAILLPTLLFAGTAPSTRIENVVDTLHGVAIEDPYRWLEDDESDEVSAWTDAQNAYFQDHITKFPDREKLQQRMEHFMSFSTFGTPSRYGQYYFQLSLIHI
ncbi:hypothetical protein GOV10_00915 [Candidatus Woesearchaeota archaeon]|nr:hypothetical protein [Candidatus Woesearchaeota archaeon]